MIDQILKWFGWFCEPGEALPVPTTPKQPRRKSEPIPDNITFDGKGKPFLTIRTTDGFESEVVTIGRVSHRTNGDNEVIANNANLKPEKYYRLKTLWAKGISAKDAANALRGERGFGQRTLDLYWASFSEAQKLDIQSRGVCHSPTVLKTIKANEPQKKRFAV